MTTTTTRDGLTVLAKTELGRTFPKTFANLTQARKAAAKVPGSHVTARWPFLVVVPVRVNDLFMSNGQLWTVEAVEGDRVRFAMGGDMSHTKALADVLAWVDAGTLVPAGRKL